MSHSIPEFPEYSEETPATSAHTTLVDASDDSWLPQKLPTTPTAPSGKPRVKLGASSSYDDYDYDAVGSAYGYAKGGALPKSTYVPPKADSLKVCAVTDVTNIQQTFLELTSQTCPSYQEVGRFGDFLTARGFTKDAHGNYYLQVGAAGNTMFTAHLDDVSTVRQNVVHIMTKNGLIATDGTTILGADDKAGMAVLLYMIEMQIQGLYVFFVAEEKGRIGSENARRTSSLPMAGIQKIVSFDRKGYTSVITHQSGMRTCSQGFATALCEQLDTFVQTGSVWLPDDTGSYTDSASFAPDIPECTNLSVGYHACHTVNESIDLHFLEALGHACAIIDWQGLPVERDPHAKPATYTALYAFILEATTRQPGETKWKKPTVDEWGLVDIAEDEILEVCELLARLIEDNPIRAAAIAKKIDEDSERFYAARRDAEVIDVTTEITDDLDNENFGQSVFPMDSGLSQDLGEEPMIADVIWADRSLGNAQDTADAMENLRMQS